MRPGHVPGQWNRHKPAKNHKNNAECRKKHLHFGADSEVLCKWTNACIGRNGPTHSPDAENACSSFSLHPLADLLFCLKVEMPDSEGVPALATMLCRSPVGRDFPVLGANSTGNRAGVPP